MPLENVTLLAAFFAGVVSFASPCVLPVIPGYLSLVTGLDVTGGEGRGRSLRVLSGTLLFIAGFSAVFVLLGLTATSVGSVLVRNQALLTRLSGVLVLGMGLYLLGSVVLRTPTFYGEKRFHPDVERFGPFAAPVAGVAFGFGWTPCIGPVLTSILALAATQTGWRSGATLLAVYSLGLGVPFLVTGLAFGRLTTVFAWVRGHMRGLTIVSAAALIGFGVLLVLNRLIWVTSQLQAALRVVGLEELIYLG